MAFPFVLGVAIDDLVDGSYRGVLWLAGLEVIGLTVGVIRRLYDTRVYTGIYTDVANRTAQKADMPVTQRAAKLRLPVEQE